MKHVWFTVGSGAQQVRRVTGGGTRYHRRVGDSFIGRRRELGALEALLGDGSRLVTVVGPGGVGKTRLVREYLARRVAPSVFVDLSAARDGLALAASVGAEIGLGAIAQADPGRPVAAALARRGRLLLVLDNVEQIVDAAAAALGPWLDEAPLVQVVATSRERLRIGAERPLVLGPLDGPASGLAGVGQRYQESLALLLVRIRALDPDFVVAPGENEILREIATELQGLPLALELAAARVRLLGLSGLRDRLRVSLDVLGSPDRDRPDRHRTLRATIAWTWELLEVEDRGALGAVAAFEGPFGPQDADAVGVSTEALEGLVDRCLVSAAPAPSSARGRQEPHYHVLRHVRDFVADAMPPDARRAQMDAHARHFGRRALASIAGVDWTRPCRLSPATRAGYRATVHAARAGETAEVGAALTVLRAWNPFIAQEGSVEEFQNLALPLLRDHRACAEHFEAALATARSLRVASRLDAAAEALGLATIQTPAQGAWVSDERARILWTGERNAEAAAEAEAALEVFDADHNELAAAFVRRLLASLAHEEGQFETSEAMERECIRTFRAHGATNMQMITQSNLGWACLHQGRHGESRALWLEALPAFAALGNRRGEGHVAMALGRLEATVGRVDAALAHLWHSRQLAIAGGDPVGEMRSTTYLGRVQILAGRSADARATLADGEELARTLEQHNPAHLAGLDRALLEWLEGDEGAAAAQLRRLQAELHPSLEVDLFVPPMALWIAALEGSPIDHPWTSTVPFALATRMLLEAIATPDAERAAAAVAQAAPVVHDSLQLRLLLRVLWVRLPAEARLPAFRRVPGALVGPGGKLVWFDAPCDLSSRPKLAALIALLAAARNQGRWVSADAIQAACWPGESILPDAARNRVFQLLNRVKKLGAVVASAPAGYSLGAEVALVPDIVRPAPLP